MQAVCIDNFGQPLLEMNKTYNVRELNLKRNVIVLDEIGYEFPIACFEVDPDFQIQKKKENLLKREDLEGQYKTIEERIEDKELEIQDLRDQIEDLESEITDLKFDLGNIQDALSELEG